MGKQKFFGLTILLALLFTQSVFATINAVISEDVTSFDPHRGHTIFDSVVLANLTEGLTHVGADLQVTPGLASKWELSKDGRRYVFTIHPNAKWSDGKSITANDFEFSWKRLSQPELKGRYSAFLENVLRYRALDTKTFEVTLSQPEPAFLVIISSFPFAPVRADSTTQKYVSSGGFRLESYLPGKKIALTPNPNYIGKKPKDGLTYYVVPSGEKSLELFRRGQIQVIPWSSRLQYLQLSSLGVERAQLLSVGGLSTVYLGFNFRSTFMQDAELRSILSECIDTKQLTQELGNDDRAASSFVPLGLSGSGFTSKRVFNPVKAKERLGLWLKNKNLQNLQLRVAARQGHRATVARILIQRMHSVFGDMLKVELKSYSSADFEKMIVPGDNYDLVVAAWLADFPDGINFLDIFRTGRFQNVMHFADKDYDDAVSKAAVTLDSKERSGYMETAQRILIDDRNAIVPLLHMNTAAIVDSALKGVKFDLLERIDLSELQR